MKVLYECAPGPTDPKMTLESIWLKVSHINYVLLVSLSPKYQATLLFKTYLFQVTGHFEPMSPTGGGGGGVVGWIRLIVISWSYHRLQVGFGGVCRCGDLMWTCLVWAVRSTPDNFGCQATASIPPQVRNHSDHLYWLWATQSDA